MNIIVKLTMLSALVAICAAQHRTFVTTHHPAMQISALVFPTEASGKLFRDFVAGIEILDVVCDGNVITGVTRDVSGYPDLLEVDTGQATMVYSRLPIELWSRKDLLSKEGLFKVVEYSLPLGSHKIEIKYRVRFPDGRKSDILELISWDRTAAPFGGEPTSLLPPKVGN